jgi:hypothetical protein
VPRIYRIVCESCEGPITGRRLSRGTGRRIHARTTLRLDGDEEVDLGHPLEIERGEEVAGIPFEELLVSDMLIYQRLLVCDGCGLVEYYRDDQNPSLRFDRPSPEELWVSQARLEEEFGAFTPDRAARAEVSHWHLRRLLGRLTDERLGAIACVACGQQRLADAEQRRSWRGHIVLVTCDRCHERVATLRTVGIS